MSKHYLAPIVALMLTLFTHSVSAFFDPPYITPGSPASGDVVSVNIRGGECDSITGVPGYPIITREGNAIRILFLGVHYDDPLLCTIPVGTATYPVGSFEAGSYTLQVDLHEPGEPASTLGTVPFTVMGVAEPPISAPTLTGMGVLALLLGLIGLVARKSRANFTQVLLVTAIALPSIGRAQTASAPDRVIEVLLSTAPGAPTAAQLVDYYARPEGNPPLPTLASTHPEAVRYLLSIRAEGDFLERLEANPNSVRAMLERYLIVIYPEEVDLDRTLSRLRSDPYIAAAYRPVPMEFSSVELIDFGIIEEPFGGGQYGRDDLNIEAAWQIAGGYSLIADIDSGLYTNHPALRQFSGSQYVGGNFIPVSSLDVSLEGIGTPPYVYDADVDERQTVLITDPNCSPGGPSMMASVYAGHGTHTAGLMAASGNAGLGVQGTCKHCGIAMWKVAYTACRPQTGDVALFYNAAANAAALTYVGDVGAQVASMSFGGDRPDHYCADLTPTPPPHASGPAMCLAIDHAYHRDTVMVAASGNHRTRLQFPASDERVVAAGGFQQNLAIWDESPGSNTNCPFAPAGNECGSNYTKFSGPKQELMGSSKWVLSTTYPGYDWNIEIGCGDGFPGPGWGNGVGLCTGTSMSTPQVAGVVGLVRSINPLVPAGKPTFNPLYGEKASLRSVLASTTAEAQANQPWSATLGYGRPDAAAAARKMLGKVARATIRNRVTPLFRLYSEATEDYVDTTSPQTALALTINQKKAWLPDTGAPWISNYPSLPFDDDDPEDPYDYFDPPPPQPTASVYVLTTEVRPRNEWLELVPLYLMDKTYASGVDFMLVTTEAEIEQAHNVAGYNLRNIQGYIYQPCTPEPACIPPGAKKFWRQYKAAANDCATFIDSEKLSFESAGYTAACPAGSTKMIGYAYPATDTDSDGLPDGFEYVVGTSPTRANSDGDTASDAVEFPMVGVPVSDPCYGGTGARYCLADSIFVNGFDGF